VQFFASGGILGQNPRLVFIDVSVHFIGQVHDLAKCLAEFPFFVQVGDFSGCVTECFQYRCFFPCPVLCEFAAEAFGDEAGRTAGDVDVLADQVGIDPCDEIFPGEIDVFDTVGEFGRQIVAQPFRIHADFQITQW